MVRKLLLAAGALGCALALLFAVAFMPAPANAKAAAHSVEALEQTLVPTLASPTLPSPAPVVVQLAPAETSVSVPVASWASSLRDILSTIMLGVLTFALTKLPAPLAWVIRAYGVQRLVDTAVALALNAVPGASKGAPLSVDVGNRVLASALQWAVNEAPGFVVKIAGGEDGLKTKIFAALHLEPDASAALLGVKSTA